MRCRIGRDGTPAKSAGGTRRRAWRLTKDEQDRIGWKRHRVLEAVYIRNRKIRAKFI